MPDHVCGLPPPLSSPASGGGGRMSSVPLLEIKNLRRAFYGLDVLRGVDLSVAAGGITGLIGPNGAGKTTLFNVISGLVPPDAGSIRFDGEETAGWAPDAVSRRGLVR